MPSNGTEKPQTNKSAITIVVFTLAINATIGVTTLAYCLTSGRELNVALLTAFVGIVNYVLGAVSGMLVKTSPTETTKSPESQPPSSGVLQAEIINKPTDPVNTAEVDPNKKP
jgi:hypothetical protein